MFKLTKDTLPIFKTFRFKNLKHFDSHDGVAYDCELFYGKDKIADVSNNGWGGETDIDYANGGEALLESLNIPQYYTNEDLGFDIDNEYIISDLVEVAIWFKESVRNQSKAIIYLRGDDIMEITLKVPFTKYMEVGKTDILLNKIKEIEARGDVVLNTNLDRLR